MKIFLFISFIFFSAPVLADTIDSTGTVVFIKKKDLRHLPAYGSLELASLQTGAVLKRNFLHLRGGRSDEFAIYIDDVLQRHPVTGNPLFDIAPSTAEKVVITTGGFGAQYGTAMSGTIHITTASTTPSWAGTTEGITDRFSRPSFGYDALSLSISSPVLPNRLSSYFSADWRDHADVSPRYGVTAHETERDKLTTEFFSHLTKGRLPHNRFSSRILRGHLTASFTKRLQLKTQITHSQSHRDHYVHSYRYNLPHAPTTQQSAYNGVASLRYVRSPQTTMTAKLRVTNISDHQGDGTHQKDLSAYARATSGPIFDNERLFYQGDRDSTSIGTNSEGLITGDEGRVYNEYIQQNTRTYTPIDFKITHQINPNHTVQTGLQIQVHHLRRYQHLSPGFRSPSSSRNVVRYGYDYNPQTNALESSTSTYDTAKHPITGAFYIQNRAQYEGLIIHVGMRLDYLNTRDQTLSDPLNPFGGGRTLDNDEVRSSRSHMTLSPRLALRQAINDQTTFHASYGIFRQLPPFQYLYTGLDYLTYRASQARTFYAFGHPDLSLPRTSAFEMGLTHRFSDLLTFNTTIYLKRVVNLIQRTTIQAQPANYDSYRNNDIATMRGIEFTTQIQPVPELSLQVSYAFSHAKGTGISDPTDIDLSPGFQAFTGPERSVPLLFERRHTLIGQLHAQLPAQVWFTAFARTATGYPYTPADPFSAQIGFFGTFPTGGVARSQRTPGFLQLDLKAGKTFRIHKYQTDFYIWAINLTNQRNIIAVYPATGQPDVSGWLSTEEGRAFGDQFGEAGRQSYRIKEQNPLNLDTPRQIRVGATLHF